ncbi:hypothetical protein K2173_008058 [Erythroxylum novogranatense]|uniref:Uncharacterized protein n=1 Tax=Erythroxylum novogranatense TaxID=1862640 RepID=A0AAV8T8G3_9ROSI|nr:hypothetical protein K2173_008058 [Erythroxylum novogranatense]
MIDKTKNHKKVLISEEDASTLLQRYAATTVLTLLQEMAQFEGVKIDWNALVKRTKTGISNPREYQMLWRHLAYHNALPDKLDDGAQPLDDDSDLEYEVEAFPEVSSEASAEAAACVKVMIASGILNDSSHTNNGTVEAPLTINIPNGQSFRATSENLQLPAQGINITVPVYVQKQHMPAGTSSEGLETNALTGGTIPARRRRKPWSTEEDTELMEAVKKFGEGNWANILRGEFKGDRTASQLSQRWTIIRKRQRKLSQAPDSSGLQLSEAQRAARHAMNLALDPPKTLVTNNSGGAMLSTFTNSIPPNAVAEPSAVQHESHQKPNLMKLSSVASASTTKSHNEVSKDPFASRNNGMAPIRSTTSNSLPSTSAAKASPAQIQSQESVVTKSTPIGMGGSAAKSQLNSDPVSAAAVATGAPIATQSDAVSPLKVAQANNAVHIIPTGGSSTTSLMSGTTAPPPSNTSAVLSSSSHTALVKASSPATLDTPLVSNLSSLSPKQTKAELLANQDAKPADTSGTE